MPINATAALVVGSVIAFFIAVAIAFATLS